MTVRKLHRTNALVLSLFIIAHLCNHLIGLTGGQNHITIMSILRLIYRTELVEIIIFILFFSQIVLGFTLIVQRGRPKEKWAWVQVISGGYIAFFLLQHLSAVIMMRLTYALLDTNFYWAASVVQAKPLGWYFLPYYAFAVLGIFAHIAAALHFRKPESKVAKHALVGMGAVMGIALPASLIGTFYSADLPPAYIDYLTSFYPNWLVSNF